MGTASALLSIFLFALISAAPLTASTFVAARMGYRGLALVVPWFGAVALGLLAGAAFEALADSNPRRIVASALSAWMGGMLVSGYISTLVHLIVLAARRLPRRPSDAAAVF